MSSGKVSPHVTHQLIQSLGHSLNHIILGKSQQIQQALTCLLAGGHLLIEDLPGMGKTTLAQGLARVLGLAFQRVQFTSDLLPADIIGSSVFHQSTGKFSFHQGPVFTQVLLADEINRASPKTQSALLEAMGEYQVTIDGETYDLPAPFFVIATQNSINQSGTFPLPESQLDRFMMRLSLGYPTPEAERQLLERNHSQSTLLNTKPIITLEQLIELQKQAHQVNASSSVLDYLQRLVSYTRESAQFISGLSPRAVLSWLHCAKAWALIHGRDYVIPDDLQALATSVIAHRLLPKDSLDEARIVINNMLQTVSVVE
ncbi:AAA family ATPase [Candidatus Endobugula sertula]|uniref:AAA family ATPase n=1 Tax=Candidatus Endobugula sertula TaxID=62101 RepID=A0A1D2QQ72_9GAMM|nr:AAA family ATPase [Candidatus Endobugula sertula]